MGIAFVNLGIASLVHDLSNLEPKSGLAPILPLHTEYKYQKIPFHDIHKQVGYISHSNLLPSDDIFGFRPQSTH